MDLQVERSTTYVVPTSATINTIKKFNHDEKRGYWEDKMFSFPFTVYAACIRNIYLFYYFHETCGGVAVFISMFFLYCLVSNPLFFTQAVMGQFSSTGFLSVYRVGLFYKGLGFIILIYNLCSVTYFSVIAAYPLANIYKLFAYEVPWNKSDGHIELRPEWVRYANVEKFDNTSQASIYFLKQVHDLNSGWNDSSLSGAVMVSVVIVWVLIMASHIKGIKSVEKVAQYTQLIPFILTFVYFGRSLASFGSIESFSFFDSTEFKKLGTFKTWGMSILMIFLTLGQSHGIILTIASHNKFREPLKRASENLPGSIMIFNVLSIFMVRAFANFLKTIGISEEAAVDGGFNLAFLLLPDFIGYAGSSQCWTAFWYILLFVNELLTVLIQAFAIMSSLFDEYVKLRRHKFFATLGVFTIFACVSIYIASGGMFPPVDKLFFYGIIAQILITIVELIAFVWNWMKMRRFNQDVEFMFDSEYFAARYHVYMTPLVLLIPFVYLCVVKMPYLPPQMTMWPVPVTIAFFAICLLIFPGYILYKYGWKEKGPWEVRMRESVKPKKWHPADPEEYRKYVDMTCNSYINTENVNLEP